MSDELREEVARAILETWHVHPWELADTFHKDNSLLEADAAIALVRDDTLEEAAARLDREWPGPASSIVRAMKGQTTT